MPTIPSVAPRRTSPALLLSLLALWLLATLGLRPLLLPDEGRYAEVARAMLHGDLLVPTLDGLPFFHKPPLFYWLDIAALQLLGVHEFAGRFGSAVGAWVMGAALFLAMRRWHGPRAAAIALGVLATTPFFFIGAQYANHDMLVGGLITAAVLAIARAVDDPKRVVLRWLVVGWVLCALAVLAKGLIGIVLPALVIGPWLLAQRRWRQMLRLLHPLGLLAFVAVAAPWFVAMQLRYPGFFDYFIVEQHFRRFAQTNFNNVHGTWFFIVAMPLLTLPWSAWLPAAIQRHRALRDRHVGLYAWWLVAVLGFFSIPSSKLVGYALPALAPWCALLGRVSDPMSGYFMVKRAAIADVAMHPLGYKILVEVIGRGRVRWIAEVGYVFRERHQGESKVTWRVYIDYLRHLVRLRLDALSTTRFLRFAVVGASGVLVDMAVLFLLSDPRSLGLGLTRSKIAAAELAIISNFLLNDAWTFRDLVGAQRGARHKLRRLLKFNAVCGIGLLLNVALLNFQFNVLHINRYVANLIAIGVVTAWNYWLNLKLNWRDAGAAG